MADTNMNRRAALRLATSTLACGAGAAVTIAGLAVSEAKGATLSTISPELLRLIAECDQAKRELVAFTHDVFDPARERWLQARDAVPHLTFDGTGPIGEPMHYSTADGGMVQTCLRIVKDAERSRRAKPYVADSRRLVAGWKRRERALERLRVASGFDAAWERNEPIEAATSDAEDAVIAFPAVSMADVIAKIDFMERIKILRSGEVDEHAALAIVADVRRLSGREG